MGADDETSATVAAAKRWGVEWTKVAGLCDAKYIGTSLAITCGRCKKEFVDTLPQEYCPECKLIRSYDARMHFARQPKVDRRIYAERGRD